MKFHLAAACATLAMAAPTPAPAQQQSYETPLYTPSPRPELDKSYGLPTFGTAGTEVPKPQSTAPAATSDALRSPAATDAMPPSGSTAPPDTDFLKDAGHFANDFPDVTLPSDRRKRSEQTSSPTSDPTSIFDRAAAATTGSTMDDTPLYTTSEGMTTGDTGTSMTTK